MDRTVDDSRPNLPRRTRTPGPAERSSHEPLGFHVTMRRMDDRGIAREPGALRCAARILLQHGRERGLAAFRVADLVRDAALLPTVQAAADELLQRDRVRAERLVARWIGSAVRYASA